MARKIRKQRRKPRRKEEVFAESNAAIAKAEEAAEAATPKNMRAHVLFAAERAVNGSRDVAYGAPENNFTRIKDLWNTYLECRPVGHRGAIVETDVAIINILLKVGRLAGNPGHIDSWIDIAGYAACGAEIASKP